MSMNSGDETLSHILFCQVLNEFYDQREMNWIEKVALTFIIHT